MPDIGQNLGSLAALDTALAVTAGGGWTSGSSRNIGASSSPQAMLSAAQFSITNSGSTDGYDLDVNVQFSDDGSAWPDDGDGQPVTNFYDAAAGADKTRSRIFEFPIALQYFRFQFRNNNATDNLSVSSETAEHLDQYATS